MKFPFLRFSLTFLGNPVRHSCPMGDRASSSRSRSPVDRRHRCDGRHFSDRPRSPHGRASPRATSDRHRRSPSLDPVAAAIGAFTSSMRAALGGASSWNSVSFFRDIRSRYLSRLFYLLYFWVCRSHIRWDVSVLQRQSSENEIKSYRIFLSR